MPIHPTAVISRQADLDGSVDVGPYVVIEGAVKIAANTQIKAHAYLSGWTEIGRDCEVHPFAVIGAPPQDFHYRGERSYTKVGDRVIIREGATVHRGTQSESSTVIAAVSGHVEIEEAAIVSGYTLIHQFVRIGKLAFISAAARVSMDVPPFMTAFGESTIVQYNTVGMKRAGYAAEEIDEVRRAFRILYRSGRLFRKSIEQVAAMVKTPAGRTLADFIRVDSQRGYCLGSPGHRRRGPAPPDA